MIQKENACNKNFPLLTGKEKKVLDLVAEAKTNKEIACDLKISPATVKRHLENILRKLQLRNRVEAAVYSVRMGDLPLDVTSHSVSPSVSRGLSDR